MENGTTNMNNIARGVNYDGVTSSVVLGDHGAVRHWTLVSVEVFNGRTSVVPDVWFYNR